MHCCPLKSPLKSLPSYNPSPATYTTTAPCTSTGDSTLGCDLTFISRTDLVGHLRIQRTEPGEPVSGTLTYSHRTRLDPLHCPHTFIYRTSSSDNMRLHEKTCDRTPLPVPHPS
ncbi:unnamed protein product [Dibothriocephalus latus]|uniref:C2H2-type domain-containing protein n=1 Tax=Dibothriocephalus latus TaxID=60516 RepID=A0A3P7NW18_DIBLA|nr:unnamed protein product [Dibothriocephalus latus]